RADSALTTIDSIERLIAEADPEHSQPAPVSEHPDVHSVAAQPVETSPCVVCHGTAATTRFVIDGVPEKLVVCDGCGVGSLFPMPGSRRIASFYPAEYYGAAEAKFEPLVEFGVCLGARLRARSLMHGVPGGSRVLDIGCGRGVMLKGLLDLGYEAHGVEMSAAAAAGADPRAQIHIAPQLADAGFDDSSFDAVVLWHVFEHLPHPDRTLDELRRIMKPGGRLIIAVPNFASWQSRALGADWFHLDLPRHLYHYTPDALRRLLNRYEFECSAINHFALLQNPFGWLQSWLNRVTDAPRNSLYSLLHRGGQHPDLRQMTWRQRTSLKTCYRLGLPVAACISILEALRQQGGTIAVSATLSDLQTIDDVLQTAAPANLAGAFA
ncbi:MAG: class I SAM-dependent methyltransferase, partial [Planctomycetota bacterium]